MRVYETFEVVSILHGNQMILIAKTNPLDGIKNFFQQIFESRFLALLLSVKITSSYCSKKIIQTLFALFSLSPSADANIQIDLSNQPLVLNNYAYSEGLSHSVVTALAQDEKGYLWIGTQYGLDRFNGTFFKQYFKNHSSNSLIDNYITSLAVDKTNHLWIGTAKGAGFLDESDNFNLIVFPTPANQQKSQWIQDIVIDEQQRVWIATFYGLWVITDHKNNEPTPVAGLESLLIEDLEIREHQLWIVTKNKLWMMDNLNGNPKLKQSPTNWGMQVNNIHWIKSGSQNLWLIYNEGLSCYKQINGRWEKQQIPNYQVLGDVYDVIENGVESWISSDKGLWRYQYQENIWSLYSANPLAKNGLPTNKTRNLFFDNKGLLWIGTFGAGLSAKIDRSQKNQHWLNQLQLALYLSKNISPADVTGISEDKSFNLWVSTRGSGVFKLSPEGKILQHISTDTNIRISNSMVENVLVDYHDNVWIASTGGGLYRLNKDNQISHYLYQPQAKHPQERAKIHDNYILDIYQDRLGRIWLGSMTELELYKPDLDTFELKSQLIPDSFRQVGERVSAIHQTIDGTLWIGGDAGLVWIDETRGESGHFTSKTPDNSLSHNDVNAMAEDPQGNLWVATYSGINQVSKNGGDWLIQNYHQLPAIADKPYYAIESDEKGNIWLGGNQGLWRFNPGNLELMSFSKEQSSVLQEFNPGASSTGDSGYISMGGVNGFEHFVPGNIEPYVFSPSIVLEELKADNQLLSLHEDQGGYIDIPANIKLLHLKIDTINLVSGRLSSTRIRLPKLSLQWHEWRKDGNFMLMGLKAGDYVVEVETMNELSPKIFNQRLIKLRVADYSFIRKHHQQMVGILIILMVVFISLFKLKEWQKERLKLLAKGRHYKKRLHKTDIQLKKHRQDIQRLNTELLDSHNENMDLQYKLSQVQLVDQQTGLQTSQYIKIDIEKRIRQLLSYYLAEGQVNLTINPQLSPKIAFVLLQIDHIEELRKDGGHFLLTSVTRQVADFLEAFARGTDQIAVWKNNCFLMVAQCANSQEIDVLCQRLSEAIASHEFGPSELERFSISCSISATEFPFVSQSPLEFDWNKLVEFSTSGLELCKENGGNGWNVIRSAHENVTQLDLRTYRYNLNDFLKSNKVRVSMFNYSNLG
ncbi:MAG: hypothetical protein COW84_10275 [Gammaproteobacteria bacterium CG22_combo_CG10-13_8_21_14_all_40_8]|nr:MAG: hypothetical protein COW84_10275 [Gammaproteobacteria bacterium CG22_combo_CG10-13_8_21_14_all_40_8]